MDFQTDLFGNPLDVGRKQGRPAHEPDQASIISVMVMLAGGMTNKEIASTVGLDVKTLKRHYDHLLRQRLVMLARLRSKLRTEQIRLGLAGNATALSNAIRMLDAVSAESAARSLREKAANQPAPTGYVSKKEMSQKAAEAVGGKYAVRPPPRLATHNGQAIAGEAEEV